MGDMTSETGIAHESIKYSIKNNLPIQFIIEDNNLSVCTDTRKTWGMNKLTYAESNQNILKFTNIKTSILMLELE